MTDCTFRPLTATNLPILEEFLYLAIFLPPGAAALPWDIIYKPEIYVYAEGFGGLDDCGVLAERGGQPLGAAWARIIPAFGHINDETPELAIAVLPQERGRGLGTALLAALFETLRARGVRQTSLSVQKENPAARLYRRVGYEIVGENEEDYIMVKRL